MDKSGNVLVADTSNCTIRKVNPLGVVTTLAGKAGAYGNTDGTGSEARFSWPYGIAVDTEGIAYVADTYNRSIRKVTKEGVVTTVAAGLQEPRAVAVDATGNLYVADNVNADIGWILKVSKGGGVTVFAGGFKFPTSVALGSHGEIYVADYIYRTLSRVDASGVIVSVSNNSLEPQGLAADGSGGVYFSKADHIIRRYSRLGVVSTVAALAGVSGSLDGDRVALYGVAVDAAGSVYVADAADSTLRKVTARGEITTLAGLAITPGSADAIGGEARFDHPSGVAVDSAKNAFVCDTVNHTIRKVSPDGVVTTFVGSPGQSGAADGGSGDARFNSPVGLAMDGSSNLYVTEKSRAFVRKVTPDGVVSTLDIGADACPFGLAADRAGNLYFALFSAHSIWKVDVGGGTTFLAGNSHTPGFRDGVGETAEFNSPYGLTVDTEGNVYVADLGNRRVRKVTPEGSVTTLPGRFGSSNSDHFGLAADSAGNIYVSDTYNWEVWKLSKSSVLTLLAGTSDMPGSDDGTGDEVRFGMTPGGSVFDTIPGGVAVDSAGNVYVADTYNNTIRKGFPALTIRSLGPTYGADGAVYGFTFVGGSGQSVVVEASGDLARWAPIWTNTSLDAFRFSVGRADGGTQRFYRARNP